MGCKSAIYTANSTATVTAVGSTIPFGSIIRRFGQNIDLSGTAINICGRGYYDVDISVTANATAAGTVTVTLFKDGVAVPGATASATASAAGDAVNLSIEALVREMCCDSTSTLILVLTGAAATVTNVAAVVEKL